METNAHPGFSTDPAISVSRVVRIECSKEMAQVAMRCEPDRSRSTESGVGCGESSSRSVCKAAKARAPCVFGSPISEI